MKGFIEVHEIGGFFSHKPVKIAIRHIRTYEGYDYIAEEDKHKTSIQFSHGTAIKLYSAEYKVEEPVWEVERLIKEAQYDRELL